jgi:tetrahydromethanopterin S-methyltransferase subunit G
MRRAVDPADLRWTTEQWKYGKEQAEATWAEGVQRMDRKYGKGFFPGFSNFGLASNQLTIEYAITGDWIFRWMGDWLFLATFGDPKRIEWEATDKDGLWNRKYRKQKIGKVEMELARLADEMYDQKEREDSDERGALARRLKDHNAELRQAVGEDVGKPIMLRSLQTNAPAPFKKPDPEQKPEHDYLVGPFAQVCGLSHRDAAAKLNAMGIKTPKGGKWHSEQVRRHRKQFGR